MPNSNFQSRVPRPPATSGDPLRDRIEGLLPRGPTQQLYIDMIKYLAEHGPDQWEKGDNKRRESFVRGLTQAILAAREDAKRRR